MPTVDRVKCTLRDALNLAVEDNEPASIGAMLQAKALLGKIGEASGSEIDNYYLALVNFVLSDLYLHQDETESAVSVGEEAIEHLDSLLAGTGLITADARIAVAEAAVEVATAHLQMEAPEKALPILQRCRAYADSENEGSAGLESLSRLRGRIGAQLAHALLLGSAWQSNLSQAETLLRQSIGNYQIAENSEEMTTYDELAVAAAQQSLAEILYYKGLSKSASIILVTAEKRLTAALPHLAPHALDDALDGFYRQALYTLCDAGETTECRRIITALKRLAANPETTSSYVAQYPELTEWYNAELALSTGDHAGARSSIEAAQSTATQLLTKDYYGEWPLTFMASVLETRGELFSETGDDATAEKLFILACHLLQRAILVQENSDDTLAQQAGILESTAYTMSNDRHASITQLLARAGAIAEALIERQPDNGYYHGLRVSIMLSRAEKEEQAGRSGAEVAAAALVLIKKHGHPNESLTDKLNLCSGLAMTGKTQEASKLAREILSTGWKRRWFLKFCRDHQLKLD